ncbi:MAG: hypothetical protein A2Z16_10205 [Chloroflexi bacterium RBG_16_54_18]|nr:MAG: hypothetical protein A2Z16_10205 [Chloroflexi bacterium RBG_16_54_18]
MDKFSLSLEPRAELMIHALERRYLTWAGQLPVFYRKMALAESTFTGREGAGKFQISRTLNPLNARSPWLFWDLFSKLEDELFLDAAEAGAFNSLSTVVLDHLVDGQYSSPGMIALFQGKLFQKGQSKFRLLFPADSIFWQDFDHYNDQYSWALGLEAETQNHPHILPNKAFIDSATAKASPMLITLAAFTAISNQPELQGPIEKSLGACAVAGQLHDDLLDWRADYENRHLTWFLLQLLSAEEWKSEKPIPLSELEERNFEDKRDLVVFGETIGWFDKAKEAIRAINCQGWQRYLEEYRSIAVEHQRACAAYHLKRVLFPALKLGSR